MSQVEQHSRDRLSAKVAIVTGAGNEGEETLPGVGAAIAITFARQGARLCLFDRDVTSAEPTRQSIESQGGKAVVTIGDVTLADDCQRAVRDAVAAFGCLDILVNNVGAGAAPSSLEAIDDARRKLRRNISPLGIEGDGWDIARAALFLASDEA